MAELTKEHFDQRLTRLEANLTEQNETLARMVKKGFDTALTINLPQS